MAMNKNRAGRRAARTALLARVGQASATEPVKVRRKSRTRRSATRTLLLATAALAIMGITLLATPNSARAALPVGDVPEIDPGSMASALTLISGGFLMLTGRSRRV